MSLVSRRVISGIVDADCFLNAETWNIDGRQNGSLALRAKASGKSESDTFIKQERCLFDFSLLCSWKRGVHGNVELFFTCVPRKKAKLSIPV